MTMDKLIDEILKGCEHDGSFIPVTEVKRLMQAYHEAKLKEELITFLRHREYQGNSAPDIMVENIVDDYLKTRTNV